MSKYWIFKYLTVLSLLSFVSCKKDKAEAPELTPVVITYGSMTDQEGNSYKTVKIGTQTWMAENLWTTKYRNGDPIPLISENQAWQDATVGAYCNYNNTTDTEFIKSYGRLYNQSALTDSRNIAPAGWHVPSIEEIEVLINFLGENVAAKKMVEKGTTHWTKANDATNESGFTCLPSGLRMGYGAYFQGLGTMCNFWSKDINMGCSVSFDSQTGNTYAITRNQFGLYSNSGLALRLVKNNEY